MESKKEAFATAHLVFTLIRGIHSLAEEDIKQTLKKYDVQYTCFRLLWILFFDEKMTMTELSYISQTNISNTYRQLVKLNDQRLVVIDKGKDARIKEVSLTKIGRQLVQEILSSNLQISDLNLMDLLTQISKKDLDTFIKVASILSTKLIGQRFTDWAIETANRVKEEGH